MPTAIRPMLATSVKEPFDDDEWIFELKHDGYRIIAFCKAGSVKLQSRGQQNYTKRYPVIVEALQQLGADAVLDGELVVLDENGHSDFDALQRYREHEHHLVFYVFDILWLNGRSLVNRPLTERKEILRRLLPKHANIRYSDHIEAAGTAFFEQVTSLGLEGIVCKKADAVYRENERTKSWLKVTTRLRIDVLVGGWTESDSPRSFKSLLFGWYDKGQFVFVGHAGGGYKDAEIKEIYNELRKIEIKNKPFVNEVDTDRKAHWCKPVKVMEVEFATWTDSGKIRKPATFIRFRTDKKPQEITRVEGLIEAKPKQSKGRAAPKAATKTNPDSNWNELDRLPVSRTDQVEIGDHQLTLTNIDKEYWRGITKGDLLNYYIRISHFILPHVKDRPLSLYIKHRGPAAPGLYIKDMEGREPSFAQIHSTPRLHHREGKRDQIDYLVCNNLATLIYVINLGCIDLNAWSSTIHHPHEPGYIIIDLDPSDDNFSKAVTTAQAAKQYLDQQKLKAFIKTSGKTGIHILVPCRGFSFKQARTIAEIMCKEVQQLVPAIATVAVSKKERGDKLFVDFSQNDYADTIASAYSIRPGTSPNVSTPLDWKELKPGLSAEDFTIQNIEKRLDKKGDLLVGVYDEKTAMANAKRLTRLL